MKWVTYSRALQCCFIFLTFSGALHTNNIRISFFVSKDETQNSERCRESLDSNNDSRVIDVHFSNREVTNLIEKVEHECNEKDKKASKRTYTRFTPGKWQTLVTDKLWREHGIPCGFKFNSRVTDKKTATIEGKKIHIENF